VSKSGSGGGAGSTGSSAGTARVREASGIDYKKSDGARASGDVAVKVSVSKLDKAWKKDISHVGKDGKGGIRDPGADKTRYDKAKEFVGKGGPVNMPRVNYDAKKDKVVFSDGRHRVAVIRDKGKKTTWITVPRGQAKKVKKKFGA
jgi:hypothetical protein